MARDPMDAALARLISTLEDVGIPVGRAELDEVAAGGYLKPVVAFGKTEGGDDPRRLADFYAEACPPEAMDRRRFRDPAGSAADAKGAGSAAPAHSVPDLGIEEASRFLLEDALNPEELLEAALARIALRDGEIGAFQLLLEEEARMAAREAGRELRSGLRRGPLHGIPVAVKDILDLAGTPTTAGSTILAGALAERDSAAVARLRAAGAVIVGKTRMSEFAYSPGSNNDHYGPTRNPLAPDRDTGGSSSGSAAAVADHMVFGALGTDTGGSIRIPAAFCGLVGLKPSFGRASLAGAVGLSPSLDHLGPLARSVVDAADLLEAVAGPDPLDPRTRPATLGFRRAAISGEAGIAGTRVGVLGDDGSGRALADPGCLAAWKRGLEALERAGAVLVPLDLPELQATRALNGVILAIEAARVHQGWMRTRLGDYGAFPRVRLLAGFAYGPTDYLRAQEERAALRRRCEAIFAEVDLLSTPTMPSEAPPLGTPARLTFTAPFNLLGWPALSLPVGSGAAGLPCGMQLVGKPWDEGSVLKAARAAEMGL